MVHCWCLVIPIVLVIDLSWGTPIIHGLDVGKIQRSRGQIVVKNPGTFQYVVYIKGDAHDESNNQNLPLICGGIVLSSTHVLTVAHCIQNELFKVRKLTVRAGVVDVKYEKKITQVIPVKGYKIHEGFNQWKRAGFLKRTGYYQKNDIAILWLDKPLDKTVKIAQRHEKPFGIDNLYGNAVGWGQTELGHASWMLKKAVLKVISREDCSQYYPTVEISKSKQFCAFDDLKRSAPSRGDSGGPIVHNDVVLGLSSYGITERRKLDDGTFVTAITPKAPSVYTNIFAYKEWIKESMKKNGPTKLCKDTSKDKFCTFF